MIRRGLPLLLLWTWACASTAPAPRSGDAERAAAQREPQLDDAPPAEAATRATHLPRDDGDDDELDAGVELVEADHDEPCDDGGEALAEGEGDEELDDGGEEEPEGWIAGWQERQPHPLDGLSTSELADRFRQDPASLGPMSLGRIHGGALINGVPMPEGEGWIIRQPNAAYGTQETVDAIQTCIEHVRDRFEKTPPLYIGHLSRRRGGRFPPHVSHQNGRDVDLGYYYRGDEGWYTLAQAQNLDATRTWSLVRCFITETDVEMILTVRPIAKMLREQAEELGEDSHWLDQLFGGKTATVRPIIRHARGHGTHLHVRFYSPIARETGRRMYATLVKSKVIQIPSAYHFHRARKGHTLAYLAKRYRTSQRAIKRANGLRNTMIREGKTYRIPRRGAVSKIEAPGPVKIPHRRLPPAPRGGQNSSAKAAP